MRARAYLQADGGDDYLRQHQKELENIQLFYTQMAARRHSEALLGDDPGHGDKP